MSEMIERVARAIAMSVGARMSSPGQSVATREFGWKGDGEHLDQYVEAHWKEHVHAAEFAIEAMREPTKEMAAAGKHALETSARGARQLTDMGHSVMTFPHLAAWRAMIDQALVEH